MKKSVYMWLLMMISVALAACSDKSEDFSNVDGAEKVSWQWVETIEPDGGDLELSFTALASWQAVSSGDWCVISSPTDGKGGAGKSTLKLTATANYTSGWRFSTITLTFAGYKTMTFKVQQNKTDVVVTGETDMNPTIDEILAKYYLWNDDYKALTRDLTIPYQDSYSNFLTTTLMGMETNTLDKKWNADYEQYTLYSYITQTPKKTTTKAVKVGGVNHKVEKDDPIKSYGIARLMGVYLVDESGKATGEYAFVVEAVYPGSAATAWNVKRGTIIYEIDDEPITANNFNSLYLELLSPTKSQITLLAMTDGEEHNPILMPTEIDPSPILKNSVIEQNGHKVGYLVYSAFDAAYDDDLLAVLADFKSQGITDLVLDLRYNGGGHLASCMMLSACVAGSSCKDKVFQYYRYNATRMATVENTKKDTGNLYDTAAGYFYSNFVYDNYYSVNLSEYALGLNRLYVLTTGATASASEALINSLGGIDFPVIIIGEKSNGKNVGMEVSEFNAGNYSYEVAPITFQYYNAKKETISEEGLLPSHQVDEWNNGLVDFGETDEPLLGKALELITGTATGKAATRAASAVTMKQMPLQPEHPSLPHRRGALQLLPSAE